MRSSSAADTPQSVRAIATDSVAPVRDEPLDEPIDVALRQVALATRGFMPPEEGDALFAAALDAAAHCEGPFVEVGSYCGRSTVWLGGAARRSGRTLFAVDHHGGSEENQPGWEWHEPDLVDPGTGRLDTLPTFRSTISQAGLGDTVVAVVGDSHTVARSWATPLALLFIDGGHGVEPATLDYELWTPQVARGGTLVIHDVFPDPNDGGRPPYENIYLPALASGQFEEVSSTGSLRVLRRL